MFPSPFRGFYISIYLQNFCKFYGANVSVPFPGFLYINYNLSKSNTRRERKFPSPFRGFYISMQILRIFHRAYRFPSPFRGFYISILSSVSLIFSGLQSQTSAQNHIWLITFRNLISKYSERQYFRLSAQKLKNILLFFI